MTPEALARLIHLAEARKAAALARLDAVMAKIRACEAEIADSASVYQRDMTEDPNVPIVQLGMRTAWADRRITQARRRIAALGPALAEARAAAIQGLGKHQALEKLAEQAEREIAQIRAARLERDEPFPDPPSSRGG